MIRNTRRSAHEYCDDSQLSYEKYQTEFIGGHGLTFDDAYRLAHLPLVAPDHPLVIPSKPGANYDRGVHDLIYSVAIPISANKLLQSQKFIEFYDELKTTKFAHKISWETYDQRKDKLHATICGTLSIGKEPLINDRVYDDLRAIGPVAISVRGVFSGNINIGRLYLKIYPELRDGRNMCHEIQKIFGTPLTCLYVVGLLNFVEELDSSETQDLNDVIKRWRNCEFFQLSLDNLWLLKSRDDLVLDGSITKIIPLG